MNFTEQEKNALSQDYLNGFSDAVDTVVRVLDALVESAPEGFDREAGALMFLRERLTTPVTE